ncbi:MAG: hypothetical protein AAGJ35_12660, partial [Myxococcota bacterium]
GEIRWAGHSLGSQLAVAAASILLNQYPQQKHLLPQRIALLDPAYLKGPRPFLNQSTVAKTALQKAQELILSGVVLESYRSSALVSNPIVGDANEALLKQTAFTELRPHYFRFDEQHRKHMVAKWQYLWSFAFPPPPIRNSKQQAPSASMTTSTLRTWMGSKYKFVQDRGKMTKILTDDVMRQVRK